MIPFESYVLAHRARRAHAQVKLRQRAAAARAFAEAIAARLGPVFSLKRVVLFGSLARGQFTDRSDIDLAVEGLPEGKLIEASLLANQGSPFEISVVPLERSHPHIQRAIEAEGVILWER